MKKTNRFIAFVLACCLASSPLTLLKAEEAAFNEDFDAFMHDEYVEMMESDYANLHFSLRDYEKEGITKPEVTLGVPSLDEREEDLAALEKTMEKLKSFDYNTLNDTQKHDYDALMFDLSNSIDGLKLPDLTMLFAPGSGVTDNLLTNFTEFVLYEKVDIDDYLTLLDTIDGFMDGCLEITKQQAEKGLFLNDRQLEATLDSIDEFVSKKDGNPLIVIFNENVDAFEGLSDEEREAYKKKNEEIVFGKFIPTYEKVAKELKALEGSRLYEGGYSDYEEQGNAFYRNLIQVKSSTTKSVEEQVEEMTGFLRSKLSEMRAIYAKNPNIEEEMEAVVGMDEPMEVLKYHQAHMQEYPVGPEVNYKVSYLDQSVANDSVVAYYMQPPVDFLKDNVIRINGANVADENGLYETLAHEGFPGHLYQITWYYNTNPNRLRTCLNNIGYTEGWAMFTEIKSWQKAPVLTQDAKDLHGLYTALGYVQQSCIDLGVNGLGWDIDGVKEWLEGIDMNSDYAEELYEFAVDYPGQLVPYGTGLMHFFMLEKQAKDALGESFDETEFLTVLLTNGDRCFDIVENDVKEYVESKDGVMAKAIFEEVPSESYEKSFFQSKEGVYTVIGVLVVIVVVSVMVAKRSKKDDPIEH